MKNPKVSTITLTRNRKKILRKALESIKKQTFKDYEMIVIDNNSTDGTQEMVKEEFPEAKLIELDSNRGVAGRNEGAKIARGEILFLVDDDAYIDKDAIKNAVKHFEKDPKLGIACFKALKPGKKEVGDWVYNMPKEEYKDKEFYTTCFTATESAIRAKLLEKMPYFYNEDFIVYGEEYDTAYKILDLGYDIKYFPDVEVYHRVRTELSPRRYYLERRNMLWVYWINLPFSYATKRTLTLILKGFVSIPKGLLGTHFKYLLAAFLGLPRIVRKYRKPIKKETLQKIAKINKLGYY